MMLVNPPRDVMLPFPRWEIIFAVVVSPISGGDFPSSDIQSAHVGRVNAEGTEVKIPVTIHSPNSKCKWALAGCEYAD
jgi:hypothetical protein